MPKNGLYELAKEAINTLFSDTKECYCNSRRHIVADHPVVGCIVPDCECARLEEPDA